MAYIKILNLRSKNWIRNVSNYIRDEKKTDDSRRNAKSEGPQSDLRMFMEEGVEIGEENADVQNAISNLVEYSANARKTREHRLVTGINCTAPYAADEMTSLIDFWKAERRITGVSRDAFHIIQSFNPRDNDRLTPELAHEIGRKYAFELQHMDDKAEVNRRYMMLICTHVDREHIHNHIVMCSYDIDTGRKFHECREVYRQMKEASNRLCKEYGLSVIDNPDIRRKHSRSEWQEAKKGNSWKDDLRKNIEAIVLVSRSWDEYVRNMETVGYHLRQGKHVTYTDPDGHRVRDNTLGREWTKEAIVNNIEKQKHMMRKGSDHKEKIRRFYQEQDELRRRESERYSDTISPYDEEGRRRSELEMVLLTAMQMILEGEAYGIGDGYAVENSTREKKEMQKQRRYRRIAAVMEDAKKAGIGSEEELKARLDRTGAELSHVKLEIKKNQDLLCRMEAVMQVLREYEEVRNTVESISLLPEGEMKENIRRQREEEITRYKKAKAALYRFRCAGDDQIADFRTRYENLKEKLSLLRIRSGMLRRDYKGLMRIKDGLELARNEDFILGRLYEEDGPDADGRREEPQQKGNAKSNEER